MKIWLGTRIKSFGYAFRGVGMLFRYETHAQVHLLALIVVCTAGIVTGLQTWEWVAIVLIVALVLAAEAINTALEALADGLHPGHHPMVGKAKDIAAGAVLLCAFAALIVALLIFTPYWFS